MPKHRDEKLLVAIGRRFQRIRREAGWTQEQLAEALDIQPVTLSRWERGERALSLSALAQSAAILEVSLGDLLDTGRRAPAGPKDAGFAELKKLWKSLDEDERDLVVRLVREVGRR